MNPKELNRIFQTGKCLSLETMRVYNEGKLPAKSTHEVEKHLLECSLCASAIDGLNARRITDVAKVSSNIDKRLAVYINTPPSTPILSRFGVAMIVSSVIIAIGLIVWLVSSNSTTPEIYIADTGAITQYEPPSPEKNSKVIPAKTGERSRENGAVSIPVNSGNTETEKTEVEHRTASNLPATLPGNEKSLNVDPITNDPQKTAVGDPLQDNTKQAAADQFLRIKSVVVYPPTSHNDKKPKQQNNDGQISRSREDKGAFEVNEMPTYPGGNEALKNYVLSSFSPQKENKTALKRKTTGVMFQVNAKTGEVSGASLSFPVSVVTDTELLRVMNAMPRWNPGTKRGTVDVMLGITFE